MFSNEPKSISFDSWQPFFNIWWYEKNIHSFVPWKTFTKTDEAEIVTQSVQNMNEEQSLYVTLPSAVMKKNTQK